YVLGDLLGRGGMAEVFAGHSVGDHGFQKPVAIKRLLPELAHDEVFVERLIEEAKLLVGMQHGQIVSVLDLARDGDDVFLVMEFVDGPSLRQLIKARGARGLSLGIATYIVQMAAAGLEFAHSRAGGAIIHADISPSNLLLTTSGEVRVADFGIARREGLGQGVVEGKWAYMAPEQARGESLTPSSDVFALGVVLYELLTGQHPFGRAVSASQRDEQMRVTPPRKIKPGIPAGLDAICMRALAHDRRDRYPRMQALIDDLVEERFANGYREGASDLAAAIREVAPRPDPVAAQPRTMHTERPITLMTRSLIQEATPIGRPAPRPRPSSPAPRLSSAAIGGGVPPPRDAFPMQPTVGVQAIERLELPDRVGSQPVIQPSLAVSGSLASDDELPSESFPAGEVSDEFDDAAALAATEAREVDQGALAAAARAAAVAMFQQMPAALRADGTPMPPFRFHPSMIAPPRAPHDLDEELASVVGGGHTMTARGLAVAVEERSNRWAYAILAVAALIGMVAAVAFQLRSDHDRTDERAQPIAVAAPLAPAAPPPPAPAPEPAPTITDEVTLPPTIQPGAEPAAPEAAPAAEAAPAPAPEAAPAAEAAPAPAPEAPPAPAPAPAPKKPRRRAVVADKAESGILQVDSAPWSWVTVGDATKETPDKFYLAPGTYLVQFHNQENGLVKTERVTIEAGKLKRLNERMDH
ncbi:MAG TPA: serine/threonine-protein kinase, partial [Kofleriaceae bacterium]|nr:serine/threonine-protein kinase [Kofleriaceae bacterium]